MQLLQLHQPVQIMQKILQQKILQQILQTLQ